MHVRKLEIRNFKRFESISLDLGRLQLIVGPNNSGKSTVLQAMSLLQFCIRSTLRKSNNHYELANRSLGPEEFAVIPVASPQELWHDRLTQTRDRHIKIEIEASLSSGHLVLFKIDLSYNRFSIQPEGTTGSADDLIGLNVVFVPGYVGFLPKEERRTPAVRNSLIAQGRHGEIIRNILLDLKDAADSYQEFLRLLKEVFPAVDLSDPAFDDKADLYIQARYAEEGLGRGKELDVISAGSGFHQYLQIFSNILATKPTTLLLDEPDAHLFPALQKNVLKILRALVSDGKIQQILLATHSVQLITEAPAREILVLGGDTARRLSQRADLHPVLASLGSLDNRVLLELSMKRNLVIVEDREDASILEKFLIILWGEDAYRTFARRVVYLPVGGSPLNRDVGSIVNALHAFLEGAKPPAVFVISDRDYLFEDRRAELIARRGSRVQAWHIWKRTEIENYLLDARPWGRLCQQEQAGPLFQPTVEEIRARMETLIDESRKHALGRLMNRFDEQDRRRTPEQCMREAERFLEEHWSDQRLELCDAKEAVLPRLRDWLQDSYAISGANATIASMFLGEELPPEVHELGGRLHEFAATLEA